MEIRAKIADPSHIAGVDGCKAGWVAVLFPSGRPDQAEARVFPSFAELLEALPQNSLIGVDMPIGLPDRVRQGGREPDWAAREFLGLCRSRVFLIPSRSAVYTYAQGYAAVCAEAEKTSDPPRAVSKQAFWILPRIQEIDRILIGDSSARSRVFEVHPEISFALMSGGRPLLEPKKVKGRDHLPGLEQRKQLLQQNAFALTLLEAARRAGVGLDDLLDACACAWSAVRFAKGQARLFPPHPGTDAYGLEVAIRA
jgi:predicted RNase H-like nuclease